MTLWMFVVVLLLVLATALYVAAEFAIVGARVDPIEQYAQRGSRSAARLLPIVRDSAELDRYIAACQIGITISSLVLGAFGQATIGMALGTTLVEQYDMEPLAAYGLASTLVLIVLTSAHVVLGELIPKTVALQYPVRTAIYTYLPMRWSLALYRPFIRMLNGSGNLILRRFGGNPSASHRHLHSPEEIELLVSESSRSGLLEAGDSTRMREALRLSRRTARQLMVPRRQIVALDLDEPFDVLMEQIDASPFTRLPVHRGGLDQIHGMLHVKELAVALAQGKPMESIDALVRPLLAIPAGLKTDRVLAQLRERRARLALVVDEFGGIEGLISLEDVIREFVGALADEFKSGAQLQPTQLPDGRWRLPGRLPLEAMLEWAQADSNDPAWSSEAETLAGWLLERLDQVPVNGQRISAAGLHFEIEEMSGIAIQSVLVERATAAAEVSDA